jgi:hypothetical protein
MYEPAIAAEAGDKVSARRIHVAVIDRQIGSAPALDRIRKRAMAVGEKRPSQERRVGH